MLQEKEERSTVCLHSNIMLKSKFSRDPQGYLPADLLPPYTSDIRIQGMLSQRQQEQYYKKMFYASRIIDE